MEAQGEERGSAERDGQWQKEEDDERDRGPGERGESGGAGGQRQRQRKLPALCVRGSGAAAWARPARRRGTPVAYGGAARLDSGQCWGYLSRWRRAPRERTKVRRPGRLRACFSLFL